MNYKTIAKTLCSIILTATSTLAFSQQLILSETSFNFGKVKIKDKKVISVTAKNDSNSPIVITDALIPCKCTKVDYSKKPIMPKDSTTIEITFEAKESGAFYKKVTLYHSTKEKQSVIAIRGIVE